MSVFTIYAIVLTGLYIIYYPVTILMDLFSKKGQKRNGFEVFNTGAESESSDEEEESGVVVSETAEGYSVGDPVPVLEEGQQEGAGEAPVQVVEPTPVVEDSVPVDEVNERDQKLYETLTKQQLDPVSVKYQEEYDAASYLVVSQQPLHTKSRILRTIVEI